MAKWYPAHNYTPADANSLQAAPNPGAYTDLVTGDMAFVYSAGQVDALVYDSTSSATQNIPLVVTPDGNAGNGRWLKVVFGIDHKNGFDTQVGPVSDSYCTLGVAGTTVTLTHVADYNIFVDGALFTITGNESVEITDVVGLHSVYFDNTGTLVIAAPSGITTQAYITENCAVAFVYWDGDSAIMLFDERHGNGMSPATSYHLHDIYGAQWESGLSLSAFDIDGSGADATAAQFDLNSGEIHDEDIKITIAADTNATIDTLYRVGAGGPWKKFAATADYPVADGTVGDRLDWNDINGGTWQVLEVTNNQFVLTHYYASNETISGGVLGIMGQAVYASATAARTGAEVELAAITLAGLPGPEMVPIATVIWQTNDSYTNQVAAKLVSTLSGDDYIDWRSSGVSGSGSSTSDHESLGGLLGGAAGDHYHLTGTQATDLTDSGDTTLHDHDGISENTSARHTQGTDTALGTMAADIDMDDTYQVVNLQAPAALGEAIRQTANITEANLAELTGAADTNLHAHNSIIAGDSQIAITDVGVGGMNFVCDAGSKMDMTTDGTRLGGSGARVTTILDEDNMVSDSPTSLATQQSIKAYHDALPSATAYFFEDSPGAISTSAEFIELDGTAGALAMTIAAPVKGQSTVITCTNATNDCVVTLTSGNFYFSENGIEGNGDKATFNTAGQTLSLFAISATRYIVIKNIGQVGIE